MDKEAQKIIDDFVEQINGKEEELLALDAGTKAIIGRAEQRREAKRKELDQRKISEGEYKKEFLEFKEQVLKETKESLDKLVASLKG